MGEVLRRSEGPLPSPKPLNIYKRIQINNNALFELIEQGILFTNQ